MFAEKTLKRWNGVWITLLIVATIEQFRLVGETFPLPFLILYVSVVLSANYNGLWAGIISSIVASSYMTYYAYVSDSSSSVTHDVLQIGISAVVYITSAILISSTRDKDDRLKQEKAPIDPTTQNFASGNTRSVATQELVLRAIGQMNDGLLILDKDWHYAYVNKKAAHILNANKPEDLIGKHAWTANPEAVGGSLYRAFHKSLETQKSVLLEEYIEQFDGWFEVHIYPNNYGLTVYLIEITKRKQVENSLVETVEQLQLAVKAANIGLWDWNLLENKVYFSPEWKSQIGYEDHEVSNDFSEWQERVHPEDLETALQTVQKYLANPYPNYQNEFRFRHKNGTYRWILAQADLLYDDQGKPVRMLGSHIDITDRKNIVSRLQQREQLLSVIYDSVNDVIYYLAVEESGYYRFISVNQAFISITGLPYDAVVGKRVDEVIPEPSLSLVLRKYDQAIRTKKLVHWEETSDYPSGRLTGVVHISPIYDEHGHCTHLVGSVHDITERKQAEVDLRRSEEQFSSAFHVGPAGMTITRIADGKFIDANESFCELFEFDRDEVIGHTSTELNMWTPEERKRLIEQQVKTGGLHNFELVAQSKSGKLITVLFSSKRMQIDGDDCLLTTLIDITDRKQAELALSLSEERLRLSMEIANVAAWEYDLVRNQMDRSINHDRLYGMEPQAKWVIDTFLNATHPDDRDLSNRIIQESILPGGPDTYSFDFRIIWSDQSVHWLAVTAEVAKRDANGTATVIRGALTDITQRKEAEHALQESEERYRSLVEHASDGIFVSDAQGYYIDVNTSGLRMLGYTHEELIGMHLRDLVARDDLLSQPLKVEELKAGKSLLSERILVRKDGTAFSVEISAKMLPNGHLLGMVRDITERKRAEEALREREQRFRLAMENIPDVVVIYDQDLRIQFINAATTKITGRPVTDFIGRRDDEIWSPEVYKSYLPTLKEAFEAKSIRSIAVNLVLPDGIRNLHITCVPVLDKDGEIREVLGITHDFTEREQAMQMLEVQAKRLQILHEIDQAILNAQTSEKIAQETLSYIRELIPCFHINIVTIDFEIQEACILANYSEIPTQFPKGTVKRLPLDAKFLDEMRQGKIFVTDDIRTIEHSTPSLQKLAEEGVRAQIGIPLIAHGELIGRLGISSDKVAAYNAEYVGIAKQIGTQLALALYQSRLFEQVTNNSHRLEELSKRLIDAQENERRRIARELHDEMGQGLMILKLDLEIIRDQIRMQDGEMWHRLEESIQLTEIVTAQMRTMSLELRPSLLDDLGLFSALRGYLERFEQRTAIQTTLNIIGSELRMQDTIETAIFRCVQEALTNVVRHSKARRVRIDLELNPEIVKVLVEDNGIGFDPEQHSKVKQIGGTGLSGMRERLALIGGSVKISGAPNTGTRIEASIPISSPDGD